MMPHMATLLSIRVGPATQDQFNDLDARVGQAMMQAGGPPDGLMSHVVYPETTDSSSPRFDAHKPRERRTSTTYFYS